MFLKRCGRNFQSLNAIKHRSSRPEVFCKKGFFRSFEKLTGKHLCQSLFFNKVAGLRPWHRCFPVNFIMKHLWWLLLKSIATLFSIWKASRNRVSCFSSLFLTKVNVSINVLDVIWKSALNCCLMARSFPLFHGNHSFSQEKVQTFPSDFKSMINNAVF